jgi:hypothetical protein
MTSDPLLTSFALHRFSNPMTTCDYPFLAVAEDKTALLSLGNYNLTFEWTISKDAALWLAHDFERTEATLLCNLALVRQVLDAAFPGGTVFGIVAFDTELYPSGLQLSLREQTEAHEGPEYLIRGPNRYTRVYREAYKMSAVSLGERAMLDVCVATFAELAAEHAAKLTARPPPRYR